jgi:hypothetical protein
MPPPLSTSTDPQGAFGALFKSSDAGKALSSIPNAREFSFKQTGYTPGIAENSVDEHPERWGTATPGATATPGDASSGKPKDDYSNAPYAIAKKARDAASGTSDVAKAPTTPKSFKEGIGSDISVEAGVPLLSESDNA